MPTRFRGFTIMRWADFAAKVERAEASFAEYLVASLHGGEIWVLTGAFPVEFMDGLRRRTLEFMRGRAPEFHKMLEGSPDFHRIIDPETGRLYSFACCKHAAYFYRWNQDPLGAWPEVTARWSVCKVAMGLAANAYETNTPRDGVVDRLQVVRYPPAIGFLEPHADPHLHQRLFVSAYMSQRGVDYLGGGFYAVDPAGRAVELEERIGVGDIALGYATVCHGVAPVDRHKAPDWGAADGRWFLSMYSNASDEVARRHTGRPERVHVEGVLP